MEDGNVDVFLESCTIASTCNKVLRMRFLKPETVGLIPSGGYTCNRNYSKKAPMWILHMQQADNCTIQHARNGREFRLPKLPPYSVDGYCAETRTVYDFMGCFYHGHTCQPLRDLKTTGGDTLAERCERTITGVGYTVRLIWECEWDAAKIVEKKPELLTHPIMRHSPCPHAMACTGVEPRPCVSTIR
jgi:hypothetical protein